MKKVKKLMLTGFCFCCIAAFSQSNNNTSGPIPINSDPAAVPVPVQNTPSTPKTGPPINKVILRSQVDSMDAKKRTTPPPSLQVYHDSTRYIIHQGDTETAPKPKRQ